MKQRLWHICALLLVATITAGPAHTQTATQIEITTPAQMMCPNGHLWGSALVTNICWSCLFPMRIMGTVQLGEGSTPEGASDKSACYCEGNGGVPDVGFVLGLWAPVSLIEIIRQPYCSPTLGGSRIRDSFQLAGMKDGSSGSSSDDQFYNYHFFSFPLYEMLEFLLSPDCNAGGYTDLDLLYVSELDPTWAEDELAIFTQPEVVIASNPLLQAACPGDCAASTFSTAADSLWWCAGCWGNLYPHTGHVPSGGSPPRVSSLLAARSLAALHRRGLAWRTVGNESLCGGTIYPMLPKSQYRMSMLFPVPEADNARRKPAPGTSGGTGQSAVDEYEWKQGCCHNVGAQTFQWGEWRNIPATGEDFVYLLWRWSDCCVR